MPELNDKYKIQHFQNNRHTIITFWKSSKALGRFELKLYVMKALHNPAQFTSTSNLPCLFDISLITFSISCSDLTSAGMYDAFSPSSAATSLPFDVGKSQITTFAPLFTSLWSVACPSPPAPPVTKATNCYFRRNSKCVREFGK